LPEQRVRELGEVEAGVKVGGHEVRVVLLRGGGGRLVEGLAGALLTRMWSLPP
jgi:hypothetical protein